MGDWLKRIKDPRDLRGLSVEQLKEVAEDIRHEILRVMSINGGHLASSMGTVDLTLALHYVYHTPEDKLVWDVGHQAYAHKLVTGRAERFETVRQEGGLSGFLKRDESPFDAFGAGHASTSISAAVGMAIARDQLKKTNKVVAIIGDGAMSGGISYEALNNAGTLGTDLLVILNDNEMSISRNVGAMSHYFNRIIQSNFYNENRRTIVDIIKKLPSGNRLLQAANRVEESVKGLIVPGMLFEEMGFRYLGPIDGHNLEELVPALEKIRTFKGPVLLHVITRKGKGRSYAEADPITWHSPPLHFDLDDGTAPARKPGPPTYTKVFVNGLTEAARRDNRICAITAAMLEGTGLTAFEKEFPERTFDVGIAEEHAVISAAGMACDGLRPVVCIYSTFLQRAIDCIVHDVALQHLPVVFSLDRGGLVGADGPTHHGVFDLTYLRMIPEMVIMAPMDAAELRHMTHTAMRYERGPIALRFPRGNAAADQDLNEPLQELEIGKGVTLRSGGDQICLVGIGLMTQHALQAADLLEAEGIQTGVINARYVKPLDRELLLAAAQQYGILVTIEDNVVTGGFGAAVLELLAEAGVDTRVVPLGIPDRFVEHGEPASLYDKCGLSPRKIAERVKALLSTSARIHAMEVENATPVAAPIS
jgi:1-deoxy-D-xylulose-5-phosphate synthase